MSQLLQNIAVTISVGQFIEYSDGKTLLTDNDSFDPTKIAAVLYKNGVGQSLTLSKTGSNAINLSGNNDGMATLALTGVNVDTPGTLQIAFYNTTVGDEYILPFSISYDVNPYGHAVQQETITLDITGATSFYPRITQVAANDGDISLTVEGDGAITVYGRQAGSYGWQVVGSAANDSAAIVIADLTGGTMYEFYIMDESATPQPSNIVGFYLHNSALPTISEVEAWAVGVLSSLNVFKTVAVWRHQLLATEGGLEGLDKLAPCAFVGETPMQSDREGGMALNRKMQLVILVGQKSLTDGVARTGDGSTVGTVELRSLVIAALDGRNPGGGLGLDDFYYTGAEEAFKATRKHGVEVIFEANWLTN